MAQHGSMFRWHLVICTMARERAHVLHKGQAFNWYTFGQWGLKCDIILDADLYMQNHPSCFCPLSFLVSKSLYNCTRYLGMHFRVFLRVLEVCRIGKLGAGMVTWTLFSNVISLWQSPSETSLINRFSDRPWKALLGYIIITYLSDVKKIQLHEVVLSLNLHRKETF